MAQGKERIPEEWTYDVFLSLIIMERCKLAFTNMTLDIMLENWLKRNHECIYISIDRPNGHPNWVAFEEEMRSFSFTVPEPCNSDPVVGFTLWTNFKCPMGYSCIFPRAIMVKNLTRGGAWIHSLGNSNIQKNSNLLTNDFHIETGDQMEVDVDCEDRITVYETGIALCYKARDSSDFSFGGIQFTYKEDDHLGYATDGVNIDCHRSKCGHDSLQAVVHWRIRYPMDGVISNLYACSFSRIPPGTKNNQPGMDMEESNHIPHRKRRIGIRKILVAIRFLTLVVVLGIYCRLLSSMFFNSATDYILLPT